MDAVSSSEELAGNPIIKTNTEAAAKCRQTAEIMMALEQHGR